MQCFQRWQVCAARKAAIRRASLRMSRAVQLLLASNFLLGVLFFGGCETVPQGIQEAKIQMAQRIASEPAGDYFIGRRFSRVNSAASPRRTSVTKSRSQSKFAVVIPSKIEEFPTVISDRPSDLKVDPLAGEFLRYLTVEHNASPRTLKAYREALAAFRAENKTPWKKCRANDFRDYLFGLMKRGQARSYVRLQFSAFRTFYRFLAERKKL